ncbi:MAG: hypothetical protein ABIA47_03390 [bacterium]
MTKKTIEFVVAIAVLAVLILILWLIFRPEGVDQVDDAVEVEEPVTEVDGGDLAVEEPVEITPQPVARSFVERLGSFSSESNYINVSDILPLATEGLQRRLLSIADEARATDNSNYYGVSTRVLTMRVVEEGDESAILAMTTQRMESIDSPANTRVRYQEIELELINNGSGWLVDDFEWSE